MVPDRYFDSTLRAWVDRASAVFQGSSTAYLTLEWTLFLATIALAILAWPGVRSRFEQRSPRAAFLGSPALFVLAMSATIFVCRWPVITWWYDPLALDESLMLAGAITLKFDPIFWRTAQSTTSGPLNFYPLIVPALLGMPIDYAAARIIAAALVVGTLVLLFHTFRLLADEPSARVAILPAWCFYATATSSDFVQYTSEAVPVFMQTLALFLTVRWLVLGRWRSLWGAGLLIGMLPYAKMQSVLAGLALAAAVVLVALLRRRHVDSFRHLTVGPASRRSAVVHLGGFVLCGLLPTLFVLGFVAISGVMNRFLHAFVRFNFSFAAANSPPFLDGLRAAALAVFNTTEFRDLSRGLCFGVAGLLVFGTFATRHLPTAALRSLRHQWPVAALVVAPLVASFVAIAARAGLGTQAYFVHYLLFLVVPLTFAVMTLADWIGVQIATASRVGWGGRAMRYLTLALVAAVPIILMAPRLPATVQLLMPSAYYRPVVADLASIMISRQSDADDALVVWGWRPDLYVQTQRRQGISFSTIEREVGLDGVDDDTAYFRGQFMEDIERSRPAIIVDSTGPHDSTYLDRAVAGHEVFPKFAEFIERHYTSVGEVLGLRLYVRNPAAG